MKEWKNNRWSHGIISIWYHISIWVLITITIRPITITTKGHGHGHKHQRRRVIDWRGKGSSVD